MRFVLLLVLAVASLSLTGCKGNCRRLSEKLCDCALNSLAKDDCLRRASNSESANPPNATDELTCGRLYEGCDCRLIDTTKGKIACGMARDPNVGGGAADGGN